ncbi:unnamed protein product [Lota lota]
MVLCVLPYIKKKDEDDDDNVSSVVTATSPVMTSLGWELNICDTDTQSRKKKRKAFSETSENGGVADVCGCTISLHPDPCELTGRICSLTQDLQHLALPDMTGLDPSLSTNPRMDERMEERMDERRSRDRSRRPSGQTQGDQEQERTYVSRERRGYSEQRSEDSNKRPYRHYERGRPLPSHHSPEPKACVPFRTVNLGIPSQRRSTDTFIQETWRSESPQRYTYHSNFRGRGESLENSPSRHYSKSPEHCRPTGSPHGSHRRGSQSRGQIQSNVSSHDPSRPPSHAPSGHASRRSSPSRRRESIVSGSVSTSRASPTHTRGDSACIPNGGSAPRGRSRESRRPSQTYAGHGLDSERLYRNLETLSRHGSLAGPPAQYERSSRGRTAVNSSADTLVGNSREVSPLRSGRGTHSHTPQTELHSRDSRPDFASRTRDKERSGRSEASPPEGSWRGSAHSLRSAAFSQGSSPPRRDAEPHLLAHPPKSPAATMETDKGNESSSKDGDRSRSNVRRGLDALLTSEPKQTPVELEEAGMTIDDYIVLADIPRINLEPEEDLPASRRRTQSPSPRRDYRARTPSYQPEINAHSVRAELDERGRGRERGRDRREKYRDQEDGGLSRQPSATSLYSQGSDHHTGKRKSAKERVLSEPTPMQGWMCKLETDGKWTKHWFVLDDVALKYYRDLEAEESDDPEGEIELGTCVNVSDCEVEKNHGFQIHTKRAVFTLSAMTSRIRRNWIKLLKQAIQNHAHQSDTGSEKEDPLSQRSSSCQPPTLRACRESSYERSPAATGVNGTAATFRRAARHQTDCVDPDLEAKPPDLSPASQREAGEGWDRDQAKRLEERNKWFEEGITFMEMNSRWDSMELKKGSVPVPVTDTMDSELNRKWDEFERVSFRDMTPQSLIGAPTHQSGPTEDCPPLPRSETYPSSREEAYRPPLGSQTDNLSTQKSLPSMNGSQMAQSRTAEALQKEALSLRQQVEGIKRERVPMEMEVDSPCGPGAPCRARIQAMVAAHRTALQELQDQHGRETRDLEAHRDRLLQEESQGSARAMEALKRAHKEEMERAVEKARHSATQGGASVISGQVPQAESLRSEMDVLSACYSERSSELSHTEYHTKDRETELCCREREMENLRRENQELKTKLAEEISRMRCFITGQSSGVISPGHTDQGSSNVEIMLRKKTSEVEYLQKQVRCLQKEVQSLTKEKEVA